MNFKELRQFIGWERGEPITCQSLDKEIGLASDGCGWIRWENGTPPTLASISKICKTYNMVFTMYPDGEISFDRE